MKHPMKYLGSRTGHLVLIALIGIFLIPTAALAQGVTADDIESEATPLLEMVMNLIVDWGFRLLAGVVFLYGAARFLRDHSLAPIAASVVVASVLAFAPTFLDGLFKA